MINKCWELGSFCSAFIHRSQCRVHNLCTLTCLFIFQTTVLASAYPRHYSRPWLFEESLPPFACGWLPTQLPESAGQVTSFRPFVCCIRRVKLSTGFRGGEPWSPSQTPSPYPVPFWSSLLIRVGLFPITMVQFVRVPTRRYLLASVAQSDSKLTCFSSRFPRLMTSRPQRDDAFPRSQGVGDFTQHRTVSCQGSG